MSEKIIRITIKTKVDDDAIKTSFVDPALAEKYEFMSTDAKNDMEQFKKSVIDIRQDVLIPVRNKCGLDLTNLSFDELDRKLCFGIGQRGYKLVNRLRRHHFFKLGSRPKNPIDPETGITKGDFDEGDVVYIYMFKKSSLNDLINSICFAYRNGDLA